MPAGHTLEELARRVGGRVRGDASLRLNGLRPLDVAGPDDLSFLGNARYRRAAASSAAGALLTSERLVPERGGALLLVADPYAALAEIVPLFHPSPAAREGVSDRAAVAADARLGGGVFVGAFAVVGERCVVGDRAALHAGVVLGEDCEVGEGSVLYPGVAVYAGTRIGRRVIVHSGAVLGSDGFGFATVGGRHRKIPQVGRLVIGDDVEIGANVTIDRGSLGDTVIGSGSKIDNLVQIAHNVRLGENVLLVAQSGIAGSTTLGSGAVLAGQAGAAGHLRIGEGAVVASKSAVYDDIPDGAIVAGIPAREHRGWKKSQAALGRLPALRTEVRAILRRLEKLERLSEGE